MDCRGVAVVSAHTPGCAGRVYSQHSFYGCSSKPKVERDGKHYCGIHDPVRIAEKHATRNAKWEAENKAKELVRAQNAATRKEIERRAEVYDDLIRELEIIADADPAKWDEDMRGQFREWAQNRARAAIAAATEARP